MTFKLNNCGLFLVVNNSEKLLSVSKNEVEADIWNKDEHGYLKTKENDFYINVDECGIFVCKLMKGKVSQQWLYDRGCIFNAFNPNWVLGHDGNKVIAGHPSSILNSTSWDIISSNDDIDDEDDDFVIVPIPDCFDQKLPPRKEASKVVVIRSKSENKAITTYDSFDPDDESLKLYNSMVYCKDSKQKITENKTVEKENNTINLDSNHKENNNKKASLDLDKDKNYSNTEINYVNNDSNDNIGVNNNKSDDEKYVENNDANVCQHELDPFDDAYDNLEASTIKAFSNAFLVANKFLVKTINIAKDVFTSLQATDHQALGKMVDDKKKVEPWCPPTDETWEPKKDLWMPREPCWMPEEGPLTPKTTPWLPKNDLWMPKNYLWMPKEGPMEKLFEMGFTDRIKNQQALDQCKDFNQVVEQLANLKYDDSKWIHSVIND